ncbi:MAG: DUF2169 domain-containing protein [Alphaproteobacteria bacterium]|nr:DUF2169 domain-containing protein [Alphaproteobacteria bacterium]
MSRSPHAPHLDAVVDLDRNGRCAWVVVKQSWRLVPGGLVPTDVVPLVGAPGDDPRPPLAPGSDLVLGRRRTDVVVQGSAWAAGGHPTHVRDVSLTVGAARKVVRVWGRREVVFTGAGPRPGRPEPFTEVPLTWARAYGGVDARVAAPAPETVADVMRAEADHPGVYPRNPFGAGYLVDPSPVDGVVMPQLEDPARPLGSHNLVVGDPAAWWRQPLPVGFEAVSPMAWSRMAWLGGLPWHVPPDDAVLDEVRMGWLPPAWRRLPSWTRRGSPPAAWFQEAPGGQVFPWLAPGTPIGVEGMHPEQAVQAFALPAPPPVAIVVEGDVAAVQPRPTLVVVAPGAGRVSVTWLAVRTSMPRVFLKGVHGRIPLEARIGGAPAVRFEAPVPVRARVAAGC